MKRDKKELSELTKVVGLNIKAIRKSKKVTLNVIANDLGMSPSHICALEKGNRELNLRHIEVFSKYLSVSPNYIISYHLIKQRM